MRSNQFWINGEVLKLGDNFSSKLCLFMSGVTIAYFKVIGKIDELIQLVIIWKYKGVSIGSNKENNCLGNGSSGYEHLQSLINFDIAYIFGTVKLCSDDLAVDTFTIWIVSSVVN